MKISSWTLLVWILTSSLWSSVVLSACETTWFGDRCQFKCRCVYNYCDSDGRCLSGYSCERGWFGPSCQYVDLAYNKPTVPALTRVVDGDDLTCLDGVNSPYIYFNLVSQYSFTWLRVRLSKPELLSTLVVKFGRNGSLDCVSPRNASVDPTTMDVYCDTNQMIQYIHLSGDGINFLCSLYVSGGRNVALRQNASQTSSYVGPSSIQRKYIPYIANFSVDGNRNQSWRADSCSASNGDILFPRWNVSFTRSQLVNRIVLYNRGDGKLERLKGFRLEIFDKDDTVKFASTDNQTQSQYIYNIQSLPVIATLVSIMANNREHIVQICEVEIYGDSLCESGQYGRDCEHRCNCAGSESCFVSTGGCPSGCAAGFLGENCNKSCSDSRYGPGCSSNCSQFCVQNLTNPQSCDHINGNCIDGCVSGYMGLTCTEPCAEGRYGPQCNSSCSEFCSSSPNQRSCDHRNGTCFFGCVSGYQGVSCISTCANGMFGHQCNASCRDYCLDTNRTDVAVCHHVTGVCSSGCVPGPESALCAQTAADQSSTESTGVIVGAVLGAVIVVILIILAVIIVRRLRMNNRFKSAHHGPLAPCRSGELMDASSELGSVMSVVEAKDVNGKKPLEGEHKKTKSGVYYNTSSDPGSTVVSLEDLDTFMASKGLDFFKNQFRAIPANTAATMSEGMSPDNTHKNRYKNICAYDHSRVHLIPNANKKHGDYINASYIQGYKHDETFIASQGPTKIILEDFVRMLWEQQVEKVVMLTNLVEESKQKCERYWPEEGEMKVGEITVKLATTQVFADYTIRVLRLKKDGKPDHSLKHFHFTSWPDKDIPTTPWGLVDFEQRVAALPSNKPVIVHCSAGVGRTGTFIALRNVMRQAEETGEMDFFQAVKTLRRDRINMVQTVDQYVFLHRAAQVAMLCIGTSVTLGGISDRIEQLEDKLKTGKTGMEREFQSICSACENNILDNQLSEEGQSGVYENSQTTVRSMRNRDQTVVPKDLYRSTLRCENSEVQDYINAVLVPSFSKLNHQILTQLPLPTTVTDFWRLVTQYQVSLVVALQPSDDTKDETIGDYLPTNSSHNLKIPLFNIKTESVTESNGIRKQKILVTLDTEQSVNLASISSKEHRLTHLSCSTSHLDKGTLLAVTQNVRSLNPMNGGRVLFMCRNGAEYSGLVCVLSLLLDRMDNDHKLTIPLVVGTIKAIRPQVIPTLNQYRILYEVLQLYGESINEYSNLGSSGSIADSQD